MKLESKKDLITYLSGFVTTKRFDVMNAVLANRTRYITAVLEDIYQPQNASAVLRTCDCLGVQDAHIIENKNEYILNPDVTLGSSQWLSMVRHNNLKNNTQDALYQLKSKGYRLIATTPHNDDMTLSQFNLDKGKVALIFGTEITGLSETALEMADEFVKIPIYGFTESYNISVSAAIILNELMGKLRNSKINWHLTDQEKDEIIYEWLKISIKRSDLIIERYQKMNAKN